MAMFFALLLTAQAPYPEFRIGYVIIEGTNGTPAWIILGLDDLLPGQKATGASLQQAEKRLRATGLFRSNPWRSTGATVELLPNQFESESRGIRIKVQERPGNLLAFGFTEMILAYLQSDDVRLVQEMLRLALRASRAFGSQVRY